MSWTHNTQMHTHNTYEHTHTHIHVQYVVELQGKMGLISNNFKVGS